MYRTTHLPIQGSVVHNRRTLNFLEVTRVFLGTLQEKRSAAIDFDDMQMREKNIEAIRAHQLRALTDFGLVEMFAP